MSGCSTAEETPRTETDAASKSDEQFLDDVLSGLLATPKSLPCKYFYDEAGSELFEQICETPEYYVTRTELEIMNQHAAEMAAEIGRDARLIEFGSGSSLKTRELLDYATDLSVYHPVDISGDFLRDVATGLSERYPRLTISPIEADFTQPITLPEHTPGVSRNVVYFPGSTIGNFTPTEATKLLSNIRDLVGTDGGLLIGVDLVKDRSVLESAYNDSAGVTALFNQNLLARANSELHADFAIEDFEHEATWCEENSRIELHLRSTSDQQVSLAEHTIHFAKGELIHTENSHKYTPDSFRELAANAGFTQKRIWSDNRNYFSVQWLIAD